MLRFLRENDAKRYCATAIANSAHPKALIGDVKMLEYYFELVKWASASKAAQGILAVVNDSTVKINLVGMKGGFSCFLPNSPKAGEGTIFFDITQKVVFDFPSTGPEDVATQTQLDPKQGHRLTAKPPQEIPNYLCLLHELGHAKQFIETPQIFSDMRDFSTEVEHAALGRQEFWAKVAKPHPQIAPPARVAPPPMVGHALAAPPVDDEAIPAPPPMVDNSELKVESSDVYQLASHKREVEPKWNVRVDSDNLVKHEWPICEEMGLPKRNYNDMKPKKHRFLFW